MYHLGYFWVHKLLFKLFIVGPHVFMHARKSKSYGLRRLAGGKSAISPCMVVDPAAFNVWQWEHPLFPPASSKRFATPLSLSLPHVESRQLCPPIILALTLTWYVDRKFPRLPTWIMMGIDIIDPRFLLNHAISLLWSSSWPGAPMCLPEGT